MFCRLVLIPVAQTVPFQIDQGRNRARNRQSNQCV